ncbi:MAG: M13 family metallopeptidase, partial [Phormidium sp.]
MTNNNQFRVSPWLINSILLLLGIGATSCSNSLSNQSNGNKAETVSNLSNQSHSNKAETVSHTKLPLGFSVEKMDTKVDPKQDFHRFAAGKWLDTTTLPSDKLILSGLDLLSVEVSQQLQQITKQAATQSTKAPKGSPLQQVGDLYAGGMDVKRLESLGVSPLKPIFERVEAIDSLPALAKTLAQQQITLSDPVILGATVNGDLEDAKTNIITVGGGTLGLPSQDDYLSPDKAAIRQAYLDYVTAALEIAGSSPTEAASAAKKILEMETRIASKQLSPTEKRDFKKAITKISFAQLQSLLSNLDMKIYFQELGLPTTGNVLVEDSGSLADLNLMLKEYPIDDIKTYFRWALLRQTMNYLTPEFEKPLLAFNKVYYGQNFELPPRTERVTNLIGQKYGHPLSQLYVKEHFSAESKKQVEEMIQQIKTLFRGRLEGNKWLTDATRKLALEKLDRI